MIENVVIFSKETQAVLMGSTFGDIKYDAEDFKGTLEEIKKTAINLEKGTFISDYDNGLTALIHAISHLSVALVFNRSLDQKEKNEWKDIAKEIIEGFEKVYDSNSQNYFEFDKTLIEIVDWYLKEKSPIDKMKEALW
ncbi:MAG: hypothetical protein ACTSSK_09145 [Candidatus Heimdallarchaeota archaeon]